MINSVKATNIQRSPSSSPSSDLLEEALKLSDEIARTIPANKQTSYDPGMPPDWNARREKQIELATTTVRSNRYPETIEAS